MARKRIKTCPRCGAKHTEMFAICSGCLEKELNARGGVEAYLRGISRVREA